ncbi:MAG: Transcriptional repressor NrdR [Pseudomonadota bacterium]
MKCPYCGDPDTQVVETRLSEDAASVRRRRKCSACDKRFTTYERADVHFPVIVKRDGRRADYSRDKLKGSLALALRKRPVKTEDVEAAIDAIEEMLLATGEREVGSRDVGDAVMKALKKLDKVAYIRFASVYHNLDDVAEFKRLVDTLQTRSPAVKKSS